MANTNKYVNKCTIVVSSCDAYKPALTPFFTLFKKYYYNCIFDIIVVLENEKFEFDGLNIKTYNISKNNNINNLSWSKRQRDALKSISTEYVFWLIEDQFLIDYVDQNRLFNWIDIMDNDNSIASIASYHYSPKNVLFKNVDDKLYEELEKRRLISEFKLCVGGNLWRRNRLIYYLGDNESPWEWEAYANFRTFFNPNDKFYFLKNDVRKVYPFEYEGRVWSPICRGKWYLPACKPIFEKENIQVNYDELGICTDEEMNKKGRGDVKENIIIKFLRYSPFKLFISFFSHLKYLNKHHK